MSQSGCYVVTDGFCYFLDLPPETYEEMVLNDTKLVLTTGSLWVAGKTAAGDTVFPYRLLALGTTGHNRIPYVM
jgi:hypothetical protein